jgi:hypothetical protein
MPGSVAMASGSPPGAMPFGLARPRPPWPARAQLGTAWPADGFSQWSQKLSIGMSQVAPRLREVIKGRDAVDFGGVVQQVFGAAVSDLKPIHREIVASELVELGWCKRGNEPVWINER